jgi:CheY-like chemotaxis protein
MLTDVETPPNAAALRILLVEDHPEVAAAQALLLRALGYQVQTAPDGHTAIEMAKSEQPDVAVVDIGLPGIDGYQVAESLRRDPATSAIRLIALTAYGTAEDRQRSQRSGFEAHLVKPASIDQLCRALSGPPRIA